MELTFHPWRSGTFWRSPTTITTFRRRRGTPTILNGLRMLAQGRGGWRGATLGKGPKSLFPFSQLACPQAHLRQGTSQV